MKNRIYLYVLGAIFLFGFAIRIYKLDKIPPSLNWDEIAVAYNAYTIWHWGRDEWGVRLPLVFKSFGEDKMPVHIYLTAPFVGIFGPTDFNARFPHAFISSLSIIIIFLLAKKMFRSNVCGILSAFFLAFSPYHLFFSRALWELGFALFFFLTGLWLFFVGIEKNKFLYFSFLCFGLSLYSYNASKVFVLPMTFLLIVFYWKDLLRIKKHFFLSFLVLVVFLVGFLMQPRLLGLERYNQTRLSEDQLKSTYIYSKTNNLMLSVMEVALKHYPQYFSYDYLFIKGDQNPRNSVKVFGEFYKSDIIFLAVGVVALVLLHSRISLLLFTWLALAPLPAAITSQTANASRAMFMLGVIQIIAAVGATSILKIAPKKLYIYLGIFVLFMVTFFQFIPYWKYLINDYSKKEAIEWQYGMKDIVEYVKENQQYRKVYVDNIRSQPYIFFLYYLKVPLPQLLKTVSYDESKSKSFNTVLTFGKYQFGSWDWVNANPIDNVLYVLEPSKYTGLSYLKDFNVVKLVKYPDGGDAFYLVSGY